MKQGRIHLPAALLAAFLMSLAVAPAHSVSAHPTASPVTITVWDWHYSDTTPGSLGLAMRQVDKAFAAAYPTIIIKHVGQPFNSYFTLERAAVASKRGPEVVFDPQMNLHPPALKPTSATLGELGWLRNFRHSEKA